MLTGWCAAPYALTNSALNSKGVTTEQSKITRVI